MEQKRISHPCYRFPQVDISSSWLQSTSCCCRHNIQITSWHPHLSYPLSQILHPGEKHFITRVMLHLETKHLKVNYQLPKALTSENSKKSLISDSSENSLWLVCCWELFMVPKLPSHQLPVSVSSILFLFAFLSLFVFVSSGWTCGEIILLEITSWNIVAGHKQGVGLARKAKSQNDIKDRRMLCWLLGCNLGIFYISNTAIP